MQETKEVGHVLSGAEMHNEGRESVQPTPDTETGAPSARVRKEAPKETAGHKVTQPKARGDQKHDVIAPGKNLAKHEASDTHVHPDNPSAKSREAFVKSQRSAKDDTFTSPSGRVSLKDMLKK